MSRSWSVLPRPPNPRSANTSPGRWFNKGVRLGVLGRSVEAIGVFEQVVERFAEAPEPALREHVAKALVNKGVALGELGRSAEAIGVFEQVVERFAEAPEPALRAAVALALSARQETDDGAD